MLLLSRCHPRLVCAFLFLIQFWERCLDSSV